jgi:hypothetical protein
MVDFDRPVFLRTDRATRNQLTGGRGFKRWLSVGGAPRQMPMAMAWLGSRSLRAVLAILERIRQVCVLTRSHGIGKVWLVQRAGFPGEGRKSEEDFNQAVVKRFVRSADPANLLLPAITVF